MPSPTQVPTVRSEAWFNEPHLTPLQHPELSVQGLVPLLFSSSRLNIEIILPVNTP